MPNRTNHAESANSEQTTDESAVECCSHLYIPHDDIIPPGWNVVPLTRMWNSERKASGCPDECYSVIIHNGTCVLRVDQEEWTSGKKKQNYDEMSAEEDTPLQE